jgi:hypothetical protein
MTTKIIDIADEIYRELGEPSDLSHSSIAFWLRTNIGDLNILINKKFYIDEDTLEISIPENSGDVFDTVEKSIFKMIYSIHYYERLFRNALGAASVDGTIETDENGFRTKSVNKNELAKTYATLRKQINEELMILTKNYNINEAKPIQVAGDDTIGDPGRSYTYSNYVRNLENI